MKGQAWKNIKRSWSQHFGVQLATMTVLVATFTLTSVMLNMSLNLQSLLHHWGESLNMTVYLSDEDDGSRAQVEERLAAMKVFSEILFISKEQAKSEFSEDLANLLPQAIDDKEFGNPFPASFRLSFHSDLLQTKSLAHLSGWVDEIASWSGVEDVSYGQDWVKNYQSLVVGVGQLGAFLMVILFGGAFLVIGNCLRSSIGQRREEIEILELVGATPQMIRWPYMAEGAWMGFLAGVMALMISAGLHHLAVDLMRSQMVFSTLARHLEFLSPVWSMAVVAVATAIGLVGSFLVVRSYNDGWAASQKVNS